MDVGSLDVFLPENQISIKFLHINQRKNIQYSQRQSKARHFKNLCLLAYYFNSFLQFKIVKQNMETIRKNIFKKSTNALIHTKPNTNKTQI